MKKGFLGLLSGMSSGMIGAIVLTVAAAGYGTFMFESKRTMPRDYRTLEHDIADLHSKINDYLNSPVLPPLESSWREVSGFMRVHGLELLPDDGSEGTDAATYEGPIKSWVGFVIGKPDQVLAAIKKSQTIAPVYLLDYRVASGEMKINVAVLGI